VVYTICCCLDGQDVKPKLKRYVGNKLYVYAVKLHPIPLPKLNVVNMDGKAIKLVSRVCIPISRMELFGKERAINFAKKSCLNGILGEIEKNKVLQFNVYDNPHTLATVVESELIVNVFP
jgi:hypothetical protein